MKANESSLELYKVAKHLLPLIETLKFKKVVECNNLAKLSA